MKKSLFLASLPAALTLFVSTFQPALAQVNDATSKVSITPVTFNLTANAGDTLKEVLKVRNDAAVTQTLNISAENFVAIGEEGQIGLTAETTPFTLAQWIVFDQDTYTLKSGQEVQVPYNIRVPINAEPGGHYASVYARISPTKVGDTSVSSVGQKIGALVLLRVAGDIKESGRIDSVTTSQKDPASPVNFLLRIQNQGSVHIRPRGFITITNIFGTKVTDIQVNDQNVFPGAVRQMTAQWKNHPWIGSFTANILMQYGQNNQQMTGTTTFWIIPWKDLSIYGGILLVVLIILFLGRRRVGRAFKAMISGK